MVVLGQGDRVRRIGPVDQSRRQQHEVGATDLLGPVQDPFEHGRGNHRIVSAPRIISQMNDGVTAGKEIRGTRIRQVDLTEIDLGIGNQADPIEGPDRADPRLGRQQLDDPPPNRARGPGDRQRSHWRTMQV